MTSLRKLASDFKEMARVLGLPTAVRWLFLVFFNLSRVLRSRNLQAADLAMGKGPFTVHFPGLHPFRIQGTGAVTGIREMYVRDSYLRGGLLAIADGDVVVDLGANIGNFSNLALAHGGQVRVVAVEPSKRLNDDFEASLGLNPGFRERAQLVRAFMGTEGEVQRAAMRDPSYSSDFISEVEFLEKTGLQRIDFLKCDIEGGEFGLLVPGSRLLAMTTKLAAEVHSFAGDVDGFAAMLANEGFQLLLKDVSSDGSAVILARR